MNTLWIVVIAAVQMILAVAAPGYIDAGPAVQMVVAVATVRRTELPPLAAR